MHADDKSVDNPGALASMCSVSCKAPADKQCVKAMQAHQLLQKCAYARACTGLLLKKPLQGTISSSTVDKAAAEPLCRW